MYICIHDIFIYIYVYVSTLHLCMITNTLACAYIYSCRQTDRQIDRQTDRQRQTETDRDRMAEYIL